MNARGWAVAVAVVAGGALASWALVATHGRRQAPTALPVLPAHASSSPATQASPSPLPRVTLADGPAQAVGKAMAAEDAVADDVVFLVVATLAARCTPGSAHGLPKMATVAGLPVLRAGGQGDDGRHAVAAVVRAAAAAAPCGSAFTLAIGPSVRTIDPRAYAAAFPDSYFDPGLAVVPDEFRGQPLDARAADACNRVAYAVLPLDAPRAWQCAGLRAGARKRVRGICAAQGADADGAAASIREAVDHLPATCQ
jgi:hypothetical protein